MRNIIDEDVAVEQRERLDAWAEGVGHRAERDAGRKADQVHERDDLDRMLAQFGEGGHHLGRVVDLVELPQRWDLVEEIVAEPVGELVGQELEHGRKARTVQTGQCAGAGGPKTMVRPATIASRRRTGPGPACRRRR